MPDATPSGPAPRAPAPRPLEPHFRLAPAYAGQLAWCLALTAVLTGVCLWAGFAQSLPSARALGLHLVLVTGVLAALWRMVALRGDVSLEREARAESRRKADERARAGRGSLFSEEPEGVPRHWTPEFKLEGYAYVGQRIVLLAACLAAGALSVLYLARPVAGLSPRWVLSVGALELVIGFACVLASRYFGLVGAKGIREAAPLAGWLRGAQWLSFAAALSLFFAKVTEFKYPGVERWVTRVILAWTVLCALELAVRAAIGLFGARRPYDEVEVPMALVSTDLVFASANPLKSLTEGLEKYLGISLQASWGLRFIGRAFIPLVFVLGLLMWGMTALEVVHPHEVGLLEHWGRYTGTPLKPGLHLKWPWPIDQVHHYPATQVSEVTIGFTPLAGAKRLEFILWTRVHADEYSLVLNEGNDLLALNAYVYYRIVEREVAGYAYRFQNPDEALRVLCYRELMRGILPYKLDDLLGRDRQVLPAALLRRIRETVEAEGLGVEVLDVAFVGLHPPVDAADAYQAVVSAQIEFDTRKYKEAAFRELAVAAAEARAVEARSQAESDALTRTSLARGQTEAYQALLGAYRQAPALFARERLASVHEQGLAGRRFTVIDDALDTGSEMILDLRRGYLPWGLEPMRGPR